MRSTLLLLLLFCIPLTGAAQADRSFVTSDSVHLFVKAVGHGSPCIFLHGGPGAWSLSFEALGGQTLEQQLTMYYLDQRGAGRSGGDAQTNYSLERMVQDIEELRLHIGADKVYLLAHSFGGILANAYAARFPQHVKGMILANCTLDVDRSLQAQTGFVNTLLGTRFNDKARDSAFPAFLQARRALAEKGWNYKMLSDNEAAVQRLDSVDASMERNSALARTALGYAEYHKDYRPGSAAINVLVLVIAGKADHNIGPDQYKTFQYPRQQVKLIDGGHLLYYEHNKAFAAAVFAFIR